MPFVLHTLFAAISVSRVLKLQSLTMVTYAMAWAGVRHTQLLDVVTGQCLACLRTFSSKVCLDLLYNLTPCSVWQLASMWVSPALSVDFAMCVVRMFLLQSCALRADSNGAP